MAMFLDTRGRSTIAIAICARCSRKFPRDELVKDPNSPGLMVCREDRDDFDPWRLPPRSPDRIALEWARPDTDLTPGSHPVYIAPLQAVIGVQAGNPAVVGDGLGNAIAVAPPATPLLVETVWGANRLYGTVGAVVTPIDPVGPATAGNLIYQFICIVPGTSGATAPAWTTKTGTTVQDYTVLWINGGLYLP